MFFGLGWAGGRLGPPGGEGGSATSPLPRPAPPSHRGRAHPRAAPAHSAVCRASHSSSGPGCVILSLVVVPLRGPGQSLVLPSALLRRVAALCRPLRPVLLPVSFPRSRSPVVGVPGLCWMWRDVPFAHQRRPIVGVLRMCWLLPGSFDCCCCPRASVGGSPPTAPPGPPPPLHHRHQTWHWMVNFFHQIYGK